MEIKIVQDFDGEEVQGVEVSDMGNCILTLYFEADCDAETVDSALDAGDQGLCESVGDKLEAVPLSFDVTGC